MIRHVRRALFQTLLACCAAAIPVTSSASGGDDFMENIFVPQFHVPKAELQGYAGGKLGVLHGEYWRVYHVLAWRALHGHALTAQTTHKLNIDGSLVGPPALAGIQPWDDRKNGVDAWMAARDSSTS
jgi:hypothetical protein